MDKLKLLEDLINLKSNSSFFSLKFFHYIRFLFYFFFETNLFFDKGLIIPTDLVTNIFLLKFKYIQESFNIVFPLNLIIDH